MVSSRITVLGVKGIPLVKPGDDLAELICRAVKKQGISINDNDVIVVAQTVVSKAEGMIFKLAEIKPSLKAKHIAERVGKNPEVVELILREAEEIIRLQGSHLITQTHHGFICANSAVDVSNVSGGDSATTLPKDPDQSARRLRMRFKKLTGRNIVVIISDSSGRPLRMGQVGIAVGSSGLKPILDRRGDIDLFGKILRVKMSAVADDLASAAQLVMGEGDEGIPAAIIAGYPYVADGKAGANLLNRHNKYDLFV